MKITELAKVVAPEAKHQIVGIRPGEKLHEQMIGVEDAASTFEYKDYYKILPVINDWAEDQDRIKNGKKVSPDFTYDSERNDQWMSPEDLQIWLKSNIEKLGSI